jgi:MinD superfamily P-loop ATPase
MTYFYISEECIECGSCAPFCKNGAIEWVEIRYVIDPSKCDACGTCREYCPMDDAILEVQEPGFSPASSL